jgi:dephospho-CoA kinase
MSGGGKSTALAELSRRGCATVDSDRGGWIEVVHGEPLWREDRITELLDRARPRSLFVGGTVANQALFYDRFDAVVLLTAPLDTLLDRVAVRSGNDFGKAPHERAAIVRDHAMIEPLLRTAATHVIDTAGGIDDVVDQLLAVAGGASRG